MLETLKCDGEVNHGHFDADFGNVMRVGHLGGHEESEVLVVVHIGVSKSNLEDTRVTLCLLLKKNGIDGWINSLLHILNEAWKSISYSSGNISQECGWPELKHNKTVVLLHVLNPLIGLLLRINAKGISLSLKSQDTVFTGNLITWEAGNTPVSKGDWISHGSNEGEVFTGWDLSFESSLHPLGYELFSVLSSECTKVGDASA